MNKDELNAEWINHKYLVNDYPKVGYKYVNEEKTEINYLGAILMAKAIEQEHGYNHLDILRRIVIEGDDWSHDTKKEINRYIKLNK